jgi:hypothetical protein
MECHLCHQSLALLGPIVIHYARTWHCKALASLRRCAAAGHGHRGGGSLTYDERGKAHAHGVAQAAVGGQNPQVSSK